MESAGADFRVTGWFSQALSRLAWSGFGWESNFVRLLATVRSICGTLAGLRCRFEQECHYIEYEYEYDN